MKIGPARSSLGRLILTVAAFAGVMAAAAPAPADNLYGGPMPDSTAPSLERAGEMRVDLSSQGQAGKTLSIPRGKSAIVELPVDARDVLVTNPLVADTVLRSPRKIYVMGLEAGQTDAVFFDGAGRRILALSIRVDQDFSAVGDTIARILPGTKVTAQGVNTSVVLTGLVANQSDADKAVQIAQQFVSKPDQVINMLTIAGKEQVMLKVRGDQAAGLQSVSDPGPGRQPAISAQLRGRIRGQRQPAGRTVGRLQHGHHPAARDQCLRPHHQGL